MERTQKIVVFFYHDKKAEEQRENKREAKEEAMQQYITELLEKKNESGDLSIFAAVALCLYNALYDCL